MIYWLFTIGGILCIFFFLCMHFQCRSNEKKITLLQNLTEAVVLYFIFYMIVSGILFFFNRYNMLLCTLFTFLLALLPVCAIFVSMIRKKQAINLQSIAFISSFQESWLSYAAILAIAIVSAGWFGFFGMGQDQGVYQTEAISLLNGNTEWTQNLEEYDALSDSEYKQFFLERIESIAGYDSVLQSADIPGVILHEDTNEASGIWHGIPTWASMLALSVRLFGLNNMPLIQAIFFICFLLLLECLLKYLHIPFYLRAILLCLTGLSPEIVWIKKSTLTEMFLALLLVLYLYYLLNPDEKKRYWSVIPLIGYCFFHVSAFTLMPIWIFIYWYLFHTSKQKHFLTCSRLLIIGYFAGFFMMYRLQPRYTLLNYQNALSFLPIKTIPVLVVAACIIAWLLTILLERKAASIKINYNKVIKRSGQFISAAAVLFLLAKIFVKGCSVYEFSLTTIVCFATLTGFFLMPFLIWKLLSGTYDSDSDMNVLVLLFLWCVLIYALITRRNVQYYYYYGRYLAPFISIIIILFAYMVENTINRISRRSRSGSAVLRKCISAAPIIGLLLILPYTKVILTNQDDTYVHWNVLSDILDTIGDYDIALIDSDLAREYFFSAASIDGTNAYIVSDEITAALEQLDTEGKSILYLSDDILENENATLSVKYRNKNISQEDNLLNYSELGFPTDFAGRGQRTITIYDVQYLQSK